MSVMFSNFEMEKKSLSRLRMACTVLFYSVLMAEDKQEYLKQAG